MKPDLYKALLNATATLHQIAALAYKDAGRKLQADPPNISGHDVMKQLGDTALEESVNIRIALDHYLGKEAAGMVKGELGFDIIPPPSHCPMPNGETLTAIPTKAQVNYSSVLAWLEDSRAQVFYTGKPDAPMCNVMIYRDGYYPLQLKAPTITDCATLYKAAIWEPKQ